MFAKVGNNYLNVNNVADVADNEDHLIILFDFVNPRADLRRAFVASRTSRDRAHSAQKEPVDLRPTEGGDELRRRNSGSRRRTGLALATRIRGLTRIDSPDTP